MSTTRAAVRPSVTRSGAARPGVAQPPRRVRDQAREALAVMGFSAVMSVGTAVALLLLTSVGR